MELPDVSLGELYSLLGEKDVKIYQLEKVHGILERKIEDIPEKAPEEKDPFKKGK